MNISATGVKFDDHTMWVDLSDGRTIGVPYAWFPRLLNAKKSQRENVEIGRYGLHWAEIDEDISVAGLLAGRGDRTMGNLSAVNAAPARTGQGSAKRKKRAWEVTARSRTRLRATSFWPTK